MANLPPTITDGTVTLTFGAAGQYYGYSTIADVKFEFPNRSSFTTLDNSTVAQEITFAAQEIQDLLDYTYQMPYVGTNGGILLTLRNLNAKLATAEIIDRYFQGAEPDMSPAAVERRQFVELILSDLVHGAVRWDNPFGDAVSRGMLPQYQRSASAIIAPSPNSINPYEANPIFSITTPSVFRRDGNF